MTKTENDLINENMGLVVHIVKKFNPPNETELEEYTQAGMIGLLKSIRKHDPSISKLSTFAWRSISNEILHYIKSKKKHKNIVAFSTINNKPSPEENFRNRDFYLDYGHEEKEQIENLLPTNLSEAERNIITLKLSGYSTKEIIRKLPGLKENELNKFYKSAIKKIRKANE